MTAVMRRSDFCFAALKEQTATVFLVLPPDRIGTYSRWLRLMVAQAMTELARSPLQPPTPVLFLLDEFAALGRLEPVERAMGLMAGYGVQLWPILQDLHQLRGTYGPRAGTFLANAGLVQVFNVNDTDTADWVSRALGDTTASYETDSRGETRQRHRLGAGSTSTGTAAHLVRRALLTPDEVRRLPADGQVLFKAGAPPIFARKLRYYADPEFRGLFDAGATAGYPRQWLMQPVVDLCHDHDLPLRKPGVRSMTKRVYLAGPEVFLVNARDIGARKRAICERHGLVGVFPGDEEDACDPTLPLPERGLAISRAIERAMRGCDAMIVNLTPFRGTERRCRLGL